MSNSGSISENDQDSFVTAGSEVAQVDQETQSDQESQGSAPSYNPFIIRLQVGEHHFTTYLHILSSESDFEWTVNPVINGELFIDTDGELFSHILKYLRTGVYPLFYDPKTGHNHFKYMELLQEARLFKFLTLEDWLERKKYLHAIKVHHADLTQLW